MKMSDVRVGMVFRDFGGVKITVTALTARGFRYSRPTVMPFIPRWGMSFAKDGHEHFGLDGECLYTLVIPEAVP